MNVGVKSFIKEEKEAIKRNNLKINNLKNLISEYETVIDVVSKTSSDGTIEIYQEKISRCWDKIYGYLDNIRNHESRIATMKKVDDVIKRGVKKSA